MAYIRFYSWSDPPFRSQPWTPSNTTNVPSGVRGLMVDTAGDVALEFADGSSDVWKVQASVFYPCLRFKKVKQTGTTATGIHLLF